MMATDAPLGPRRALNQSLDRGLLILRRMANSESELGIRELGRLMELDKTVVSRLVSTLAEHGFVEQNPVTKRYRIGPSALDIGGRSAKHARLYDVAYSRLQNVSQRHEVNVFLGVRSQSEVLYLCAVQRPNDSVFRVSAGFRGHLHATALGKVLLAAMDGAALLKLLSELALPRLTPDTIASRDRLSAEVELVRRRGYAVSDEENLVGVIAIGAPVRDGTGRVVAAVSAARHKDGMSESFADAMVGITERLAGAISAKLGAPPGVPFPP